MPTSSSTMAGRFHFLGVCGTRSVDAVTSQHSPTHHAHWLQVALTLQLWSVHAWVRIRAEEESRSHLPADALSNVLVQAARAAGWVQVHQDVACSIATGHSVRIALLSRTSTVANTAHLKALGNEVQTPGTTTQTQQRLAEPCQQSRTGPHLGAGRRG